MNTEIKVSVIVITYNQAGYIRQALDSVLAQKTPFRYEILIGDDASQDGTSQIIREYQAAHPDVIRAWIRGKNVGASANVLELLRQSRGEYLAFCEGDDYWLNPEKLAEQAAFLDSHPEYIGCSHVCRIVDENGQMHRRQRVSWLKGGKRVFRFRDFSGGRYLPGQTSTVVKRNIFRDAAPDIIRMMSADPDISDRVSNEIYLLKGDFYCMESCWSAYRCVRSAGSGHITAQKYRNNPRSCLADLRLAEKMEAYARQITGRPVRFVRKRSEILFVAIAYNLLGKDEERRGILRAVLEQTTIREMILLPAAFLKKLDNRFFCV